MMARLVNILVLLLSLLSLTLAATPTSFCKCICKGNSTIIPLNPASNGIAKTCSDCNKSFCLGYNLPICKGAEEKDVFTTCFQRDSTKDEAVVFIFIFTTLGLLGWAAIKPWVAKWTESARERRSYIPVSDER